MPFLSKFRNTSSASTSARAFEPDSPSRAASLATYVNESVDTAIDEKGKALAKAPSAEMTFEQAHAQFWQGLDTQNVNQVSSALAALPAPGRRQLAQAARTKEADKVNLAEPQRPLCVAARNGPLELCLALLEKPGAHPRLGDKLNGQQPVTALFWAAFAGHQDIMTYLHDSQGLDAKDALLAIDQNPSKDNISWLVARGLSASGFYDTFFRAVKAERRETIRALIQHGKVSCNQLISTEDASNDLSDDDSMYEQRFSRSSVRFGGGHTSALCWAIANNKLDSAEVLLDEGAAVNGEGGAKQQYAPADDSERPISLTMKRYALNGAEPKSLALLSKLLRMGAHVDSNTLKKAMGYKKPHNTLLFKKLLIEGNAAPENIKTAYSCLKIAESSQLISVAVILKELALMLQQDVTWAESEKKARDPKFHFVQLSRERVLEFVEMTDEEVDPELLELDNESTKAPKDLSLARSAKKNKSVLGSRILSESRGAAPASSNALARVKKKNNMFSSNG